MTTDPPGNQEGKCKVCEKLVSEVITWKEHHEHKLDARLQNEQDRSGYRLCDDHRCQYMTRVKARKSGDTVKKRCRDLFEAEDTRQGKRKRGDGLCKVHAEGERRAAENRKKKKEDDDDMKKDDPLHPWVLRGSRPVIAGRQLVVEDFTLIMPDGGMVEGMDQRGNVVNKLLRDRSETTLIKKISPEIDPKEDKTSFEEAFMHHWERLEDCYWFDVVVDGALGYASDRIRSINLLKHCLSLDKQTVALQATATMGGISKLDLPVQAADTMKTGRIRTMAMCALEDDANVLDRLFDPEVIRQLQRWEGECRVATAGSLVNLQNPAKIHLITGLELWFINTGEESELVVLRGGDRLELPAGHNVTVYTVEPSIAFYQGLGLGHAADVFICLEVIAGALQPENLDSVKTRLNEIEQKNQTAPESPMQGALAVLLPISQTAIDKKILADGS